MSQSIFAQFRGTQQQRHATETESVSSDPINDFPMDDSNMSSSSRKRTRDSLNDEDEVEIESATSSFRNNLPHKRPRVAPAVRNEDSEDEGEEGERTAHAAHAAHEDDDSEEEVIDMRNYDDDDESEIDESRATQIVEKQMKKYRENQAAEEGVIEEIFCRNFMCHAKLRIKLGPLINFIIGHNGSGKSAVLTALTVCLGESARKTNRGGNLKKMIKEGQENATLAVKIRNRGEGAYKPELYGRSITVERYFSRSGSGGYKLKNAEDKVVTTKKADLDDMLDYFGLQIDNPINVLTQDNARQFLSSSSATDKYKSFIKGTRLEDLDRDYDVMEENLDKIVAKLASRKEDIPELKMRYDQAKDRKAKLEKAESIGRRLDEAKNQHAWAQVEEQESMLEGYNAEVEQAGERVQELEAEAETVSGEYEGANQSFETSERLVASLKEQLVPCQEQRTAKKETFDAARAELHNAIGEERDVREHLKKAKDGVKKLESQVKEERDRIANAEGADHAQRLARLEGLEAAVVQAKQEYAAHREKRAALDRAQQDSFDALEAARAAKEQQQGMLTDAKQSLQGLKRSQTDAWAGYHQNMKRLVNAIHRETRWRQKPVGPMGTHVQLQQAKWSNQIEVTFGGTLSAFVVTNNDDRRLLTDLMKREGCVETIFVGDSNPLNNLHLPDVVYQGQQVDTILSVLTVDNHLVRNQFIINHAIEQTLLIHERAVAERLLNSQGRLPNVKAAVSIANDPRRGNRQEYTKNGAPKSSAMQPWPRPPRMQIDQQEQISEAEAVVAQYARSFDAADRSAKEKQQVNVKAGQAVKAWDREEQRLKTVVQQAEDQVEEQNNDIEAHRPKDGRLQELERQLQDLKGDVENYSMSFQDAVSAKDDVSEKAKAAKHELDEADAEFRAGKVRLENAEEKLNRMSQDRRSALFNKNEALNAIDAARKKQEDLVTKRDGQAERVREFNAQASEICRRVPLEPGMTTQHMDALITDLGKEMARQERAAGGSAEELVLRWQQAKNEYEDAKAQLNSAEVRKNRLMQTLSYRRMRWKMFRQYISFRARITFKYLLSERRFRGQVKIDHSAKEMDIEVEPDISREQDPDDKTKGREARSLSGGEKSFSTICLLLSVWEAMGSPIRCLDEFDVFMDSVNRAESMRLMIQAARRSVGRQFILITPQAMGNVQIQDDVKIHKMSDPERGQGVLPFTQAE